MEPVTGHPYLESRGIAAEVLSSPRFYGRVCRDARGNAVFPHYDREGICGYELKNRVFTGFVKGGVKGLWVSATKRADRRLVVAESAIDALIYHTLFPDERTRYISIGGQMNPTQPELLKQAIARLPRGGELVIATDADEGGGSLATVIHGLVEQVAHQDLFITRAEPQHGKDWNDQLLASGAGQLWS